MLLNFVSENIIEATTVVIKINHSCWKAYWIINWAAKL